MTAVDAQQLTLAVDGVPLEYVDGSGGSLTLDRRWTPYIQGSFTVVTPADPSIIEPRESPLLEVTWLRRLGPTLQFTSDLTAVWAGMLTSDLTSAYAGDLTSDISETPGRWYTVPGEPSSLRALLVIRGAVNHRDGTHTLRVESVESRFRDYPNPFPRPVSSTVSESGTFRGVYAALLAQLPRGFAYPAGVLELEPGEDDIVLSDLGIVDDQIAMDPGDTLFDTMQTFLGALRLWGTEDGTLRLAAPPAAPGTITITGATIIEAPEQASIDDPGWGDGLLIEYEKKSTDPQVWNWVRYYPPFDEWPVTKLLKITIPGYSPFSDLNAGYIPWPEGDKLYAPMLERAQRRYRSIPATAVNDFTARPDVVVTLTDLPDSPDLLGTVTAVTWRVDDGQMQLTLEGIDEA